GGVWLSDQRGSLIGKEYNQILRDPRVLLSLILPPILHLMLFGSVLSPDVANLHLGVVDENQTTESRELVAALAQSRSFQLTGSYASVERLSDSIARGGLCAG